MSLLVTTASSSRNDPKQESAVTQAVKGRTKIQPDTAIKAWFSHRNVIARQNTKKSFWSKPADGPGTLGYLFNLRNGLFSRELLDELSPNAPMTAKFIAMVKDYITETHLMFGAFEKVFKKLDEFPTPEVLASFSLSFYDAFTFRDASGDLISSLPALIDQAKLCGEDNKDHSQIFDRFRRKSRNSFTSNSFPNYQQSIVRSSNTKKKDGFCFYFNRPDKVCTRRPCDYRHQCSNANCGAPHPAFRCQKNSESRLK